MSITQRLFVFHEKEQHLFYFFIETCSIWGLCSLFADMIPSAFGRSWAAWLRVIQDYRNISSPSNQTKPPPLFNKLLEPQNFLSGEGLIKLWSLQVSVRPALQVTAEVGLSWFSLVNTQENSTSRNLSIFSRSNKKCVLGTVFCLFITNVL